MNRKKTLSVVLSLLYYFLLSCGGSNTTSQTYSLTIQVEGLEGTLVLQNNDEDDLTISEDGEHIFDTELEDGEDFDVSILDNPSDQNCYIDDGSGSIDGADAEVIVTCITQKNMFLTAIDFDGNLGGVSGADALCMADTNYPGNGTYKAFLADGSSRIACTTSNCGGGVSEHIDWVLSPETPYELNDGTYIGTTNSSGLFELPISATLGENGLFFTGLSIDLGSEWVSSTDDCANWTDGTSGESAILGTTFETDSRSFWEDVIGPVGCNSSQYLLCVEQ